MGYRTASLYLVGREPEYGKTVDSIVRRLFGQKAFFQTGGGGGNSPYDGQVLVPEKEGGYWPRGQGWTVGPTGDYGDCGSCHDGSGRGCGGCED